jgi:hypothetical protein
LIFGFVSEPVIFKLLLAKIKEMLLNQNKTKEILCKPEPDYRLSIGILRRLDLGSSSTPEHKLQMLKSLI